MILRRKLFSENYENNYWEIEDPIQKEFGAVKATNKALKNKFFDKVGRAAADNPGSMNPGTIRKLGRVDYKWSQPTTSLNQSINDKIGSTFNLGGGKSTTFPKLIKSNKEVMRAYRKL